MCQQKCRQICEMTIFIKLPMIMQSVKYVPLLKHIHLISIRLSTNTKLIYIYEVMLK